MKPQVEISNGGRAGSVTYREGGHSVSLDWEFALSPALAIISGPSSRNWDRRCPWAAGRQAEIFEHVASEVVRQKASGCGYEIDLASGVITVLERTAAAGGTGRGRKRTATLDSVSELDPTELEELIDLIIAEGMSGPTVDALAQIDHPRAQAVVDEACRHQVSIDVRLAAAEAQHARGRLADLEAVLVRELRLLDRPTDGLARALRLAEADPTPRVRQALLWASWNQTDCAAECARLLLRLTHGSEAVAASSAVLANLGLHHSYFERKAAFDALCETLGMTLDPS